MNGNGPIMEYKGIREAAESLKEWQKCLGLEDWVIKDILCAPHEMAKLEDMGESSFVDTTKCAAIRIVKPEYYGHRITKYCAEQTLVHELLHCKFGVIDGKAMEPLYDIFHQIMNDIANSLIMAKYDITLDYFNNVSYGDDAEDDK